MRWTEPITRMREVTPLGAPRGIWLKSNQNNVMWHGGGEAVVFFLFPASTKASGADLPQHPRETGCCVSAANAMFHTKWKWLMKHCGEVDWINQAHEMVQLRAVLNTAKEISVSVKRKKGFWTVEELLALHKSSSTWTRLCRYLDVLISVTSRNCWHAGRLTDWQTDRLTDWPCPVCKSVREWIQENAKKICKS
jgi:hypothetical protein